MENETKLKYNEGDSANMLKNIANELDRLNSNIELFIITQSGGMI